MRTVGCPASTWWASARPAVNLAGRRRSALLVTLNLAAAAIYLVHLGHGLGRWAGTRIDLDVYYRSRRQDVAARRCIYVGLQRCPGSTLTYDQINALLMALVAFDCLRRAPRWPRGILVGIAAAVKLTPAVFLLFFLLRRDLRSAARAGLSFAACTGAGFALAPRDLPNQTSRALPSSPTAGQPAGLSTVRCRPIPPTFCPK